VPARDGGLRDAADTVDGCVPNGCGSCSERGEQVDVACGNCGHYVCEDAGLVCEGAPFSHVVSVSAGGVHTCALLSGGNVRCWGENGSGSLGDGTTTNASIASTVDAATNVNSLSAGYSHSCVLLETGGVECWGVNDSGQLGDGTTVNRPSAVDVQALAGLASAVVAGGGFSCAILAGTGAVQCWGDNRGGQLGDGTLTNSSLPITVQTITGALAITLGRAHACALLPAGVVKCWGGNIKGELGDGTTSTRKQPVVVQGLSAPAQAVSVGSDHSCALLTTGAVQCWGFNLYGELGNDTKTDSLVPVDVVGLSSGVVQISAGSFHSCALMSTGGVKCWGFNAYGGLGDESTTDRTVPVDVRAGLKYAAVSAGSGKCQTCILSTTFMPQCFGPNERGQLGDGTLLDRSAPIRVQGLDGICR
jgi:alpha-tubulin suppressor-like RCC1 family protein